MNIMSSLKMIDIDNILLHEEHEAMRLEKTYNAIQRSGELCHPPIAMALKNSKYLILDGAHRYNSLKMLGCKRVPVQLINTQDFTLEAWDHVVSDGPWLSSLKKHPDLCWDTEHTQYTIVKIIKDNGSSYFLNLKNQESDFIKRLDIWHKIVASYSKYFKVTRIEKKSQSTIKKGDIHISSPTYRIEELEEIVLAGRTMPAGVTRFIINGRLLNLKIPLNLLKSSYFDQIQWEKYLYQWSNSMRMYSEPVYLCEC